MIPSPDELMEDRIERLCDELDVVGDEFTCPDCGERAILSRAVPTSCAPDAMPVCEDCGEKINVRIAE